MFPIKLLMSILSFKKGKDIERRVLQMRQRPITRLTGFQKLAILLTLISLSAVYEYFILSGKLNKILVYDELSDSLSSIKTRVLRLEYLLDMYVVASRFENTTVEMIKDEVSGLDRDINEKLFNPPSGSALPTTPCFMTAYRT